VRQVGHLQELQELRFTLGVHRILFIFFLFIFEIFTICFKEAISKLFERLHFEGRCYPV